MLQKESRKLALSVINVTTKLCDTQKKTFLYTT
jgi:hypothetical protein